MSKAQLRNCGNKRRFPSKGEALAVASEKKLGVYVCPVCAGFHLTSQVKKSTAPPQVLEAKPTFDKSLMARAKWKNA